MSSARKKEETETPRASDSVRRSVNAVTNRANQSLKNDLIASARHKCEYERSAHKTINSNLINSLIQEQSQVFYKRQLPKNKFDSSLFKSTQRVSSLQNSKARLNCLSKEEL